MARMLIPKSRVTASGGVDTVKERRGNHRYDKKNMELLERCAFFWDNLSEARRNRARLLRYVYGDQWSDYITYKGKTITEAQYIREQGNIPLVSNVMRRLVNNVVGLYTRSETEPVATARDRDEQRLGEMMTITLQCNWQTNRMGLILANLAEDYAIGGMAFERETPGYENGRKDIYSYVANPNYIFFNSGMTDPLYRDLCIIGEIHDMTFSELCHKLSKSPEDHRRLEEIYHPSQHALPAGEDIMRRHDEERMSFWTPNDLTMCRVFEVWTRELKSRYRCHDPLEGRLYKIEVEDFHNLVVEENENRLKEGEAMGMSAKDIPLIEYEYFEDYYWFFQYLAPDGTVLLEGETPFNHESHPYTISLYPFINGEIHPLAGDYLDQQRYINRLIILDDFVRRTGAKGVTMVPRSAIGDLTPEEFAEQWASVDGIIFYTPKAGDPEPKQYFSSATTLGTIDMVQLMIGMMEDISSVHGAMQGKQPYSGTSAALYSQQAANATSALAAFLLRFSSFVEDIAVKKTKLIQQYYDERRVVNIAGSSYAGVKEYDPEKARDIEFDLSIKESASTPAHRMIANDMLMELWRAGAITVEQLLQNGDFPFADSVLQSIGAVKEQISAAQAGGGQTLPSMQLPEQVRQTVAENADQQAVQRARSMFSAD